MEFILVLLIVLFVLIERVERDTVRCIDKKFWFYFSRFVVILPALLLSSVIHTISFLFSTGLPIAEIIGSFFLFGLVVPLIWFHERLYRKSIIKTNGTESRSNKKLYYRTISAIVCVYIVFGSMNYFLAHYDSSGYVPTETLKGVEVPVSLVTLAKKEQENSRAGSPTLIQYCEGYGSETFSIFTPNFGGMAKYYSMSGKHLYDRTWSDVGGEKYGLGMLLAKQVECRNVGCYSKQEVDYCGAYLR